LRNGHLSKKIDILTPYLSNYRAKYGLRELARLLSVSPQTVANHMAFFIEKNIVVYEYRNGIKYFSLNLNNLSTLMTLTCLENIESLRILDNKKLAVIIPELLSNCDSLVIFGSYSSGNQKDYSDIDVILINGKELNKHYLKEILHPFNLSWAEFKKGLFNQSPLLREVLMNHKLFGNVNRFVRLFIEYHNERR
jgi:predicted nucleotidyltransferase